MKTVYIAGPMTRIKLYNFPAFDKAKELLESKGYVVMSPADIDRLHGFDPEDLPKNYDWSSPSGLDLKDIILRDIKALLLCDVIYMLKGWESSKGARAEKCVAHWLGLEVWFEGDKL